MSERRRYGQALARARAAAYRDGEFVGQESFMTAAEILDLAERAGIGPDTRVLDLCCGVGGPGLHVARHTGCRLVGVDRDEGALELARQGAAALARRVEFRAGEVPDLAVDGPFDAVMLLETVLAFRDKDRLLRDLAPWLKPGGALAFTLEEGAPLTPDERAAMPRSDTVWLSTLEEVQALLSRHGFAVDWREDHTASHADVARRLARAFRDDREALAAALGAEACRHLVASHELWADWMDRGRVRKFALVARRVG